MSNVFHREFDSSSLRPDERLVALVCASDGMKVSVNGHEIGRIQLPDGKLNAMTLSLAPDPKAAGL